MERQGKIITAEAMRSGVSAHGAWVSQSFVVEEINKQYPKKLQFEVFGQENLNRFQLSAGKMVRVFFDIDAHEFNGRWFNSVRAYDVRDWDGTVSEAASTEMANNSSDQVGANGGGANGGGAQGGATNGGAQGGANGGGAQGGATNGGAQGAQGAQADELPFG